MKKLIPLIKSLLMPLCIIVLALITFKQDLLASTDPDLISLSVYLSLGVAAAMSIGFKKSQYFFAILIVAFNYYYQIICPAPIQAKGLLQVLVPLNILLISLVSERGIISLWGKIQFAVIIFQAFLVYWLLTSGNYIEITALQSEYGRISVLFLYPVLEYMLTAICIVIIGTMSILRYTRPEGIFIGLIVLLTLGASLTPNYQFWQLITLAGSAMIILETIKDMYHFAFLDELTGLYSRRCLNQDQLKLSGIYAIAMIDIDHFKNFNDTYGHDVGDQVLRYVASLMMRASGGGKAYRYGGEEFTLVFPGKSKEEAVSHLDQLREDMSSRPFTLRSKDRPRKKPRNKATYNKPYKKVSVTISIGVADSIKKSGPDEVIKAADKALYKAKRTGRNRVCS